MMILSKAAPPGLILRTATLLLLLLQADLCLLLHRYKRLRAPMLANSVLTFVLFFAFLCHDSFVRWLAPLGKMDAPAISNGQLKLYVWLISLYLLVSAAFAVRSLVRHRRYLNEHPGFGAVKESIDLLPEGIAFAEQSGSVVLSNLAINRLSRSLTGSVLTDLSAFSGKTRVTLPDGSAVFQLSSDAITEQGAVYTQLIASDITEQARLTHALQEKNDKLRELHMRLAIFNRQADRLIIARELLSARMQVHNEAGHVLLCCRSYLEQPESIDAAALLQLMKTTNLYLLREREDDDTSRDPLRDALDMAKAIGVTVSLEGPIPQAGKTRAILASAIHECATNTVKHADGDRLSVRTAQRGGSLLCTLTTNGAPAEQTIRETGGLRSLRTLVEDAGGSMQIRSTPGFKLTLTLPAQLPVNEP